MKIPEITLENKVVLITGASRGMGAAYAVATAQAGARVALFARSSLESTETLVKKETGVSVLTLQGDMRSLTDIERAVDRTLEAYGRLDVLVNNAGLVHVASALETTEDDWDRIMDVNLKGVFFACKFAARHMVQQRSGVLINIGSQLSHVGAARYSAYCASKGGLYLLSQALAIELGEYNIRVVTLCPGPTRTDMCRPYLEDPEKEKALLELGVLGRINDPEDLAPTLVLLASDAARMVTGCSWLVDGGTTAK